MLRKYYFLRISLVQICHCKTRRLYFPRHTHTHTFRCIHTAGDSLISSFIEADIDDKLKRQFNRLKQGNWGIDFQKKEAPPK